MNGARPHIAVAVVEDDAEIGEEVARLINSADDMACVGVFRRALAALKRIPDCAPDVVLMDIGLPDLSGLECTARLKAAAPAIEVVMYTVNEDDDLVYSALRHGASGYIVKHASAERLLAGIREVRSGGTPFSAEVARKVLRAFRPAGPAPPAEALTAREEEILRLCAQALPTKLVADRLGIAPGTVSAHLKHIYAKLGVTSRAEALLKRAGPRADGIRPASPG